MKNKSSLKEIEPIHNIEFTYDSQLRKSPAIEELFDVIRYRDLIYQLIRRDIVARYKRSILGVIWTMLQPLGLMLVITIAFSQLFGRVEGYPVYLLSGLIAWNFFSQTTTAAIHQIVWGGALMRRIYIPHTAFSISSVGTGMVNLILSLIPLLLIMLIAQRPITWAFLFVPIPLMLLTAFALGVGLMLSTMAIHFPDIKEMYLIIVQAWMYLTPVMYPADIIPITYRDWLLYLNPMYYLINIFRAPIYDGSLPSLNILIVGIAVSVLTLLVGWSYFSSQMDNFAYTA